MNAPLPWYTIRASNGDEAEAAGISAARLAARTLVEDGAHRAEIYGRRPGELHSRVVEHVDRNEHEELVLHTSTLSRSLR